MTEVIREPIPPVLQRPTDKEKKYDRQLRLWAAEGQAALEDSHVLLVNSGSGTVGIETLKNLVLPGVGRFTIADSAKVELADLGLNFFLDESSLGKLRAQCCVELLQELNPDVVGDCFIKNNADDTLETFLEQTGPYTLIIYTFPIDSTEIASISAYSRRHKIPLVSLHSAGFFSYFQINLAGNFPIVDTHPDSISITDLRLLSPWPELSTFAIGLTENLESLGAHAHGHVPYLCLLLLYLARWRTYHGSYPATYREKVAFRETVASAARRDNAEGGEENYDEAIAAVLKNVTASDGLSSAVREVFSYTPNLHEASSSFWVIVSAIKDFHSKHNALPLPGSVPDMKAESSVYVQLQNIYKSKARQDCAEVFASVQAHPNGKDIDIAEVETFCKNAAYMKMIYGIDVRPANLVMTAKQESESDENAMAPRSLLPIYLALAATSYKASATIDEIVASIEKILPGASLNLRILGIAEEVARAKGGELHNISALTGGMAAQEIIKVVTKQYVPIDNTCIFDGVESRTQILRI